MNKTLIISLEHINIISKNFTEPQLWVLKPRKCKHRN